jgi:hypothetical protein
MPLSERWQRFRHASVWADSSAPERLTARSTRYIGLNLPDRGALTRKMPAETDIAFEQAPFADAVTD